MQSFRAEAYGRLAVTTFLRHYIQFYQVPLPATSVITDVDDPRPPQAVFKFQCYTDSESLLKRFISLDNKHVDSPYDHVATDYDVVSTIRATEKSACLPLASHWVEGHQDKLQELDDLSRPAFLNYVADGLATYALVAQLESGRPSHMLPLPNCNVYLGRKEGSLITGHEKSALRTRLPTTNMRKYLLRKQGWNNSAYERVNLQGNVRTRARCNVCAGKCIRHQVLHQLATSRAPRTEVWQQTWALPILPQLRRLRSHVPLSYTERVARDVLQTT